MKLTKKQLKEVVRQIVQKCLDEELYMVSKNSLKEQEGSQHILFEPDKGLSLQERGKASGRLQKTKPAETQKQTFRGVYLEQDTELLDVEAASEIPETDVSLPPDLSQKLKNVSRTFMSGHTHLYSLQNVFEEILGLVDDPMEAVSIIYSELNAVAKEDDLISDEERRKAQKAYDALVDLAQQERFHSKYGLQL